MKKACCMIFFPGDVHGLSYALLVCTISFFDNVTISVLLLDFEKNQLSMMFLLLPKQVKIGTLK